MTATRDLLSDLLRYFNELEGEIRARFVRSQDLSQRNSFSASERDPKRVFFTKDAWGQTRRHSYGGLWNGLVAVGNGDPGGYPDFEMPDCTDLVDEDRRVRRKLEAAGREAAELLELVYRQPLRTSPEEIALRYRVCFRAPFGIVGAELPKEPKSKAAALLASRNAPLRGPAGLAHLTPSAIAAYEKAVRCGTPLSIEEWVDRLGARLQGKGATLPEQVLGRAIAREARALLAWAHERYLRPYARKTRPEASTMPPVELLRDVALAA